MLSKVRYSEPITAQRCRPQIEKKYFRGSFQLSIVTIQKNITPLET